MKSEKRPRGVKDRRYAIVYEVNASYFGTIYKMSLPCSIVNGEPEFEKDSDAFMERSFADLVRHTKLYDITMKRETTPSSPKKLICGFKENKNMVDG